jgi:hypothetical protein
MPSSSFFRTTLYVTIDHSMWRDYIGAAISIRPPDTPADRKDKKSSGLHSGWLTANFNTCPHGTEDRVIQSYARSCHGHMDDELLFYSLI